MGGPCLAWCWSRSGSASESYAWAEVQGAQRIRLGETIADAPVMFLYRSNGFCAIGLPEPLRQGSSLSSQSMELNLGLRSGTDGPAQ